MISRRLMLGGLAGLSAPALVGCGQRPAPLSAASYMPAPGSGEGYRPAVEGLDAVIDISNNVTVSDFRAVRRSGILGVIHKCTEGGDWIDPPIRRGETRPSRRGCCGAPTTSVPDNIPVPIRPWLSSPSRGRALRPCLRSISNRTSATRATRCRSLRPKPSCRSSTSKPAGYRCSTLIRPGLTANASASTVSAWASPCRPARCWRAATCGWPIIASSRRCPTPGPTRAGASGSMSPTRPKPMRPTARHRGPFPASPLRPQPVQG